MTNTSPYQPLRPEQDRTVLLEELAKQLVNWAGMSKVYRNCLTCANFVEPMELCEKYATRPPARVIAYGCDDHSDNIPY